MIYATICAKRMFQIPPLMVFSIFYGHLQFVRVWQSTHVLWTQTSTSDNWWNSIKNIYYIYQNLLTKRLIFLWDAGCLFSTSLIRVPYSNTTSLNDYYYLIKIRLSLNSQDCEPENRKKPFRSAQNLYLTLKYKISDGRTRSQWAGAQQIWRVWRGF